MRTSIAEHGRRAPADRRQERRRRTRRHRRRRSQKDVGDDRPAAEPATSRWSTRSTSASAGTFVRRRTRIRRATSATATPRRRHGRRVPRLQGHRRVPLQPAGRQRRLPRSALLGVVHELRQGEGHRSSGTRSRSSTARTRARSTTRSTPGALTHERRDPGGHSEQDADARHRADRRRGVRSAHAARRRELRADLQRHAERRPRTSRSRTRRRPAPIRGAAASASAARSRPNCRCRSITGPPTSAPSVEYANDRGFARVGYDGSFFHNNVHHADLGQPEPDHRLADARSGPGAHGAVAEHRHEHGERLGRHQACRRAQPRDGLRLGRRA